MVPAGGGRSSGGNFAVEGSVGQADADPLHPSSGGAYTITGGFWPETQSQAALPEAVFADGFES